MLQVTDLWKQTYPGASVGWLVLDQVGNPPQCVALESSKRAVENELRDKFPTGDSLLVHPPIMVYGDYYKRYAKTYHVLQQLQSILFKGKSIPRVAGLVEAMFMAELKNGLLTAGHDYAALQAPLTLDVARGDEKYVLINGKEQVAKAGDMMIGDAAGIISSIIHGPDARTRLLPDTRKAVFVVYAPAGIPQELVWQHLTDIHTYVKLIAAAVTVKQQNVYPE